MFVPPPPLDGDNTRVHQIKVLPCNTGCSICETKVKITVIKVTNIILDPLVLCLDSIITETDKGCQ